ncbi:complement C1q tumor necrosis factor-related protein 1 isoform X1 [Petaurus breviceps papuanus]|uniref:complement C1q tumor necrosis factor-related protein 1 isoform X1 n=1 Tax=Petaurus breviceps papuanus TaxID=3040969 RepID=UPI0036DCDFA7
MIGSYKLGFIFGSCLLLTLIWCETALGRASQKQQLQKDQEETQEEVKVEDLPPPLPEHTKKIEYHHEKNNPSLEEQSSDSKCFRCCDSGNPMYQPMPMPQINITILKGEKGDRGERGLQGKFGKTGSIGARGHVGPKGQKGTMGAPGDRCKNHYAAFSVGRKKPLHSNDYYQTLIFDMEFVNLYSHFNMFTGKFYCYVPGIYFFSLNVHTWNQKETYLHIMKNDAEVVILYAQAPDRMGSIIVKVKSLCPDYPPTLPAVRYLRVEKSLRCCLLTWHNWCPHGAAVCSPYSYTA